MRIDFTTEIEAGMAWLDERKPDWVQVFADDKATGLHMDDCDRCVLGHVFGSYFAEEGPLGPAWQRQGVDGLQCAAEIAAPLGFALPYPEAEYWDAENIWEDLGRQWQEAIGKRLADLGQLT